VPNGFSLFFHASQDVYREFITVRRKKASIGRICRKIDVFEGNFTSSIRATQPNLSEKTNIMSIKNLQTGLVSNSKYLTVLADQSGKLMVKVLDIEGRIAKTLETVVNQGVHQLELDMADLEKGPYIMNAFNGANFIKSIRFIKH
jgi:hypothetical protein